MRVDEVISFDMSKRPGETVLIRNLELTKYTSFCFTNSKITNIILIHLNFVYVYYCNTTVKNRNLLILLAIFLCSHIEMHDV